nr:MAG TPA: hypothetical protein [Caudoviricetes sp.]DAX76857.1 MAG TPA: hypothetical protein [Caudoviricetes sp.]
MSFIERICVLECLNFDDLLTGEAYTLQRASVAKSAISLLSA